MKKLLNVKVYTVLNLKLRAIFTQLLNEFIMFYYIYCCFIYGLEFADFYLLL